jgi:hypothetical protein
VFDLLVPQPEIERNGRVARLAQRQHGNITRVQLMDLGVGEDTIYYWCQQRWLFRVHVGVYAVGRPPSTPVEWAAAAVLACGPGAALSHGSALTLWGFIALEWQFPVHVSSPRQRRRPGIATHRVVGLTPADIRTHLGIRVTSPARTFLDCAGELGPYRLPRLMAKARRQGYLHVAQVADLEQPTRSELEDAFLTFCARYGLPQPAVNTHPWGRESDMLFVGERVIVELDGWDFHRDKYAFEDDRDRDAELLAAGFVTVRITWKRLIESPEREARRLHAILESRRG